MMSEIKPLFDEINKALIGRGDTVLKCLTALVAGGHVLLEDSPGVGKTTLSKAVAAAAGLKTKRVQFTPDTQPSDITGFTMWDAEQKKFRFHEGAVQTHVLLADEINRTSPRTQSALLQAMEEGAVSEEGITTELEKPFMVIATQNPFGAAGTMQLPHSQLDRFMMKLSLGRPTADELKEMILTRGTGAPEIRSVGSREEILSFREKAARVKISDAASEWIARLTELTHSNENIAQGASPRAALSLAAAARAAAFIDGRDYVLPEDIAALFADCFAHRLVLSSAAGMESGAARAVCGEILKSCPPPHILKR
ncbi:MAG: MoxR family ATPase [Ruminococcus sp.]|nr:MoxR family ATPase [Ruminococcus sp.]